MACIRSPREPRDQVNVDDSRIPQHHLSLPSHWHPDNHIVPTPGWRKAYRIEGTWQIDGEGHEPGDAAPIVSFIFHSKGYTVERQQVMTNLKDRSFCNTRSRVFLLVWYRRIITFFHSPPPQPELPLVRDVWIEGRVKGRIKPRREGGCCPARGSGTEKAHHQSRSISQCALVEVTR